MEERKITVRDKNGTLIAVFSNLTPSHDEEAKRNLMISPTIDITSNGDSTLTFQMLVASEKWQQIKNPENLYYCNGRVYTALNEQSFIYSGPIVNVTLIEIWYLLKTTFLQAHNVDTNIEALDDHTVKILPKTNSSLKLTVNGVKYNDSDVKDSRGIVMPRGSAGYALWAILKGTDWSLGVCDVLPNGFSAANDYGTFNVESDMKSALENIQLIQELYGGILDWDSEHKVLNLRDEKKEGTDFNTWKGYAVRKGKNISDYPNIIWDNNLITRLYPLGNGNLNIKKVNNNKGYVDNFSYTSKVYEGYLQNSNIYDTNDEGGQKTLKFWAEQQVEKYCRPRKKIEYSVLDARATEDQWHETFDVNDIVKAYYQDTESGAEVYEFLRIQHLQYNWFFPGTDSVIEVGDKVSNEVELFYQIYKTTENSAQTDYNGHISSEDIFIEVPDYYWDYLDEYYGNEQGYGSSHGGYGSVSMADMINLHVEKNIQLDDGIAKNEAQITIVADDLKAQVALEAAHYEETSKGIAENKASITATTTALYAQIDLEARHHQESLNYTTTSVANLRLYVDGDFARATLSAAYSYADNKTSQVSNALAEFEAYANREYARASVTATYDYVNQKTGEISSSLAQFQAYASQNYATASQVAQVNNNIASIRATANAAYSKAEIAASTAGSISSYIYVGNGAIYLQGSGDAALGVTGTGVYIGGDVYVNGKLIS